MEDIFSVLLQELVDGCSVLRNKQGESSQQGKMKNDSAELSLFSTIGCWNGTKQIEDNPNMDYPQQNLSF